MRPGAPVPPSGRRTGLPAGQQGTRNAFVAAFQLAEFEEGIVLPHERTLSGPKVDRLNLLRATALNFELIFMLYPDPQRRIDTLFDEAISGQPRAEERSEAA